MAAENQKQCNPGDWMRDYYRHIHERLDEVLAGERAAREQISKWDAEHGSDQCRPKRASQRQRDCAPHSAVAESFA